jgi:mono/diheme cytochrome c family protein
MIGVAGCAASPASSPPPAISTSSHGLTASQRHGQDVWFKSTFGGERFFTFVLPNPPFSLRVALDQAIASDRNTRFDNFGLINDPDCTQGDASTGYLDKCPDPEATGVVGIRKKIINGQVAIGVACASCHAGLDPGNPPSDPNHPSWQNIHPTVGNQYLQLDKIFGGHLSSHDPRYQVFQSWAPGTLDTTAIESDGINNPGIITQFFDFPNRPTFGLHYGGAPITVHRAGQGGEDDAGCTMAATRVYFNMGMCGAECMIGHLANGPGGSQTPIDLNACAQVCPDFVQEQAAVGDVCAFMQTTTSPQLVDSPGGDELVDRGAAARGAHVFATNCASCHSNGQQSPNEVFSDDLLHPVAEVGTNSCRSRTTNWQAGHIWAAFASDEQKARGPGYIRDVPLLAIWATAPFFHNNRLGPYSGDPSVKGRVAAFEGAMDQLLNPSKRTPYVSVTTDVTCLSADCSVNLPAGIPVGAFANVDRATGVNLCPDLVENEGHSYGANLSPTDKYNLTEYLKTF